MYTIENDLLRVSVSEKGAEMTAIYSKLHDLDYLWNGDPVFWGKHSPVLFPVVGALKENTFYFNGEAYTLPRHGFARDRNFEVAGVTKDSIIFALKADEQSLAVFPFLFEFHIKYIVNENSLEIAYSVINRGTGSMYFSLGAHPAFKIPLVPGTAYSDYYIEFDQAENLDRWSVAENGLIQSNPKPFLRQQDRIPLSKELFSSDALVFKNVASSSLSLKSGKTDHGLTLMMKGFPFLGIWATKNADFVCLEPWCGIADADDADQHIEHKEGIHRLAAGESFNRSLLITLF